MPVTAASEGPAIGPARTPTTTTAPTTLRADVLPPAPRGGAAAGVTADAGPSSIPRPTSGSGSGSGVGGGGGGEARSCGFTLEVATRTLAVGLAVAALVEEI